MHHLVCQLALNIMEEDKRKKLDFTGELKQTEMLNLALSKKTSTGETKVSPFSSIPQLYYNRFRCIMKILFCFYQEKV